MRDNISMKQSVKAALLALCLITLAWLGTKTQEPTVKVSNVRIIQGQGDYICLDGIRYYTHENDKSMIQLPWECK